MAEHIAHENERFVHAVLGTRHMLSEDSRWFGSTHVIIESDEVRLYQFDSQHKRELAEITLTDADMEVLYKLYQRRRGMPVVEVMHAEGATISVGTGGVAH